METRPEAKRRWFGWTRAVLLIVLLLSLLPMARIAFYNHSNVDDFRNGVLTHQAWVETHDIFAVLQKALEQTVSLYMGWQGNYAALPLFALQPAIFGEEWYCISFFVLTSAYIIAVFTSLRRLWKAFLPEQDKREADSLAALYCIMTIQLMPSPVEAFYWWNGAMLYSFFHSLLIIQLTNLLILIKRCKQGRPCVGLLCGSFFLAVLLSGSNFITALTTMEITALLLCWLIFSKHPARWRMLSIFIVALAGFAMNVFAPGNSVRRLAEAGSPALWSVLYAFVEAWQFVLERTSFPLLVFFAAIFVLLWVVPTTKLFRQWWVLPSVTGLSVLVFVSAYVPTLYATSWKGPGRVQNLYFGFWTISNILAMLSVQDGLRRLWRRHRENGLLNGMRALRPRLALPCLALCALLLCTDVCISFLSNQRERYTSVSAVDSLLSGDAAAYDMVINDRLEILAGEELNPQLPDFWQDVPPLLFFDDLTDDPQNWRNYEMARYYHKETVVKRKDK